MRDKWFYYLVLVALLLAGCGDDAPPAVDIDQAATGTAAAVAATLASLPTATPTVTPTPSPSPTPSPTAEAFTLSPIDISDFERYSLRLHIAFDGDFAEAVDLNGAVDLLANVDRGASMYRIEWTMIEDIAKVLGVNDADLLTGTTVIVYVDDVTYTANDVYVDVGGCVAEAGGDPDLLDALTTSLLQNLIVEDVTEFVLEERGIEVNSFTTDRYHLGAAETAEELSADLWVDEVGRVVRLRAAGDSVRMLSEDSVGRFAGRVEIEYDLLSLGQPVDITLPAECAEVVPVGSEP